MNKIREKHEQESQRKNNEISKQEKCTFKYLVLMFLMSSTRAALQNEWLLSGSSNLELHTLKPVYYSNRNS